jgi:hypothetical protein
MRSKKKVISVPFAELLGATELQYLREVKFSTQQTTL